VYQTQLTTTQLDHTDLEITRVGFGAVDAILTAANLELSDEDRPEIESGTR
jgi:hypothetical protein